MRHKQLSPRDWIVPVLMAIAVLFIACAVSNADEFDVRYLSKLQPQKFDVGALARLNAPVAAKAQRFDVAALAKLSPVERAAPEVTVHCMTDAPCPPCLGMEREVGPGDHELRVRWHKAKHADMPSKVRRVGASPGYPVIEFADGEVISGRRTLAQLKDLAKDHGGRPADADSITVSSP